MSEPALRAISLGGGVQSTVMTLMADRGEFEHRPDVAIFADTKWEPKAVYRNLEWLKAEVSIPIVVTSNGRNLRDDTYNGTNSSGTHGFATIPFFGINERGERSLNQRQCTSNYKIRSIERAVREFLGVKRLGAKTQIESWMGISTDEPHRVKDNRNKWITSRYPLIEANMSRQDCRAWFRQRYGDRELPRSACAGCPFRSDQEWLWLAENEPELFEDTVHVDRQLRSPEYEKHRRVKMIPFLHSSLKPLDEAVADARLRRDLQGTFASISEHWGNECEGVCGV